MRSYLRDLRHLVRYNLRDDLILLRLSLPVGFAVLCWAICYYS
jgi:hypothetical protein